MTAWAHSANASGDRHDLTQHLHEVARLAAEFADAFGAADLAYASGLFHDVGKFHPAFQQYLRWCEKHPGHRRNGGDHKGAGAQLVAAVNPVLPLIVIAHHGGLRLKPSEVKGWFLDQRVAPRLQEAVQIARQSLPELGAVEPVPLPRHINGTDWDLYWRMVFSCLVDADFLDTEAHFSPTRAPSRQSTFLPGQMLEALRNERARLNVSPTNEISRLRQEIAESCERSGALPPGVYRMTVPTGGGKTLAGMAFALRHALLHEKRRVIVAVPYTSITEQTAAVYRHVFGAGNVLEHHSAAKPNDDDDGEPGPDHAWARLAAENWDAAVVVTTTVQLFESLFGHRTSTARKLHRLTNSVLLLDEVQMLPTKYLAAILDVLRSLAEHFGTTILLSTATQPSYAHAAFRAIPEIAPDPKRTFKALKRVRYTFIAEPWSWSECAGRLSAQRQAMMVLNTKRDALSVLSELDGSALHLSTNLCGAHRRKVLDEVRRRLKAGEPCLLVTTQVVEAGVDLDFPAVFRAMGPLDRIIQAAGRCNREGKLATGEVTIFQPTSGGLPPGPYQAATQIAVKHIRSNSDLDSPDVAAAFFADLYRTVATDAEGLQPLRAKMDFLQVSRRFRMIADDVQDVLVPYVDHHAEAVAAAIDNLRHKRGSAREHMRRVRPYTVGLRRRAIDRAHAQGRIESIIEGLWRWTGPASSYDDVRGLIADGADEELLEG